MKVIRQRGFIKIILIVVIALLILSYFGISLRQIMDSKTGQDNLNFLKELGLKIWDFILSIWNTYLVPKALFVWNDIVIKYGWNFIVEMFDKLKK